MFSIEHILRVPQPQHASEVDCICCGIERDSLLALRVNRVFITNVKGTFLGMSESEEASKRR